MEIVRAADHETYLEEPNVIVVRANGDMSAEEGQELSAAHARWSTAVGGVYQLTDLTKLGRMSNAARKAIAEQSRNIDYLGIHCYGANLTQRVFATLLVTALNLLRPKDQEFEVVFYKDEQSARRGIAASSARRREKSQ